jgi:hypothetical protein
MSVEDLIEWKIFCFSIYEFLFTYLFSVPCFLKYVNEGNTVGINREELNYTMKVLTAEYCIKRLFERKTNKTNKVERRKDVLQLGT